MPSITAHMVIANEVGKILNTNTDDFYRGNLLPDVIDKDDSHMKEQGTIYLVPNLLSNLKVLDLSKDLDLGYLCHLLLDKHYLEDYLQVKYPDKNVFLDHLIYKDYDYVSYDLVKIFNLDVNYLTDILSNYDCKINEDKLQLNIRCLNQHTIGKTKYIDLESFAKFLKDISIVIAKELRTYENQSS